MNKDSKIFIVGHDDIIEKALVNHFNSDAYTNVFSSSALGLDPTIQASVYEFFQNHRPEYVFLASTRSGGIKTNQERGAEFIHHNLQSQNNVVYAAHKFGAKKLLYLAGSCVYPKDCAQPIKDEYLLTGEMEKTSEPYSVAKLAGIKLCQAFKHQYGFNAIVMVPATVYGPESDSNIETAHVMGALVGKFADAVKNNKLEVIVWGSGRARREFLYADDFVNACCFLMDHYDGEDIMHAGCGADVTIKELAQIIGEVSGFKGKIIFDETKPDGTMQKLLDNSRITQLGWKAKVSLEEGIKEMYQSFIKKGVER